VHAKLEVRSFAHSRDNRGRERKQRGMSPIRESGSAKEGRRAELVLGHLGSSFSILSIEYKLCFKLQYCWVFMIQLNPGSSGEWPLKQWVCVWRCYN